jgi:hypothetical protein
MENKQQEITHEILKNGSIEVSTTPLTNGSVETATVDDAGIRHLGYRTEVELRAATNIPPDYECISWKPNSWVQQDELGPFIAHQAKGSFKPPLPGRASAEAIYAEIRKHAPARKKLKHRVSKKGGKRMLEISIMDPHFGLACFAPAADLNYDLETARMLYLSAIDEMVHLAQAHGDIDLILFVFGNDFLHAEPSNQGKGSTHCTIGGTQQSEMLDWQHTYIFAEGTVIEGIERLTKIAPVEVVVVPGNHDAYSAFTLGRTLLNRFWNDENVTVQADPSPYKFKQWGVNLIGFEHGHNVASIRLAALMANEQPLAWAETRYREWHLGDQHRKGTGKPAVFEEQGVSVEYLPSITAPNDWHRLKAFNHQKRGALAFIWDDRRGPIARVGVNLLGDEEMRGARHGSKST